MIELINPSGERKLMNATEYVELLNKYVKTKSFKAWSDRRNISGDQAGGRDESERFCGRNVLEGKRL